ncbi:unnamed protein product [Schistocephalus solidus]|uniref:Uncharacterized protein n=1 Tax=Schistocephalus solidus TaxID=70667 RepID=A0A183SU83_SCHSO|nr:unnamed protein product [Schistocephalus solidus]
MLLWPPLTGTQLSPVSLQVVNAPVAASNWYPTLTCGSSKLGFYAPVAASNWYPTLTCGSSKLGSLLWPPLTGGECSCGLTGTQLSPVAPRSWVLPGGHTPANRHDRWAKPGEGLRCSVCLHTRRQWLADRKISGCKTQTNNNIPRPHPPRHTLQAAQVNRHILAAWNVRSLLDNPRSNRPEPRTVLVARELVRYMVDIVYDYSP